MSYKIFFLDIDGTLVNKNKEITAKTKSTLIQAQEKGLIVAVASGRPDKGIERIAKELELEKYGGYLLSYNGGRIRNCKTKEVISARNLDLETFKLATDFAKNNNADILTYEGDSIVTECHNNEFLEIEARINNLPINSVENIAKYINFDIPKCLLFGDGDYMGELEPQLRDLIGTTADVFRSEPFFLEVMPKNTDKATSIARLIEILGINQEETIACGDGFNDVSMIDYAGLGIAMENACEPAKKVANYIAPSNENDGVAHIVERFFLENK